VKSRVLTCFYIFKEQKERDTMSVDFGKLNKPGLHASFGSQKSRTGVSAQATKNLGNTTSASRSSVFSLSGRHSSNWVAGSRNNVDINKHNYQNMRANLNSRGFVQPQQGGNWGSFGIGSSGMNMGMMNGMTNVNYNPNMSQVTGNVVGQVLNGTFGLLNNLGVFDGLKSNASSAVSDLSSAVGSLGGNHSVSNSTTFSGQLSGATSFNQLNSLESTVNTKKASLDSDYQSLNPKEEMGEIKDKGKEGFELAGVTLNTDNLTLSTLDSNDLEACMETIESDIAKFGNFQTNELPAAKGQITTKSGQVKGEISAKEGQLSQLKANNKDGQNDAQIQELEQQIRDLKKQQEQLKTAEDAISELESKCESTKADLETKKAEVKDMKQFEDKVKDKKYDLAKSQDKELGKTLDKLKKLDAEIKKASVDKNGSDYNKKDDKRADKLKQLNAERAEVFGKMSGLISSLSAAGGQGIKIQNSKGNEVQITNLEKAMQYKPEGEES